MFLYELCRVDGIGEAIGATVFDEDTKSEIINSLVVEEGVHINRLEMVPPVEKRILHVGDIVCVDAQHLFFKSAVAQSVFFYDAGEHLTATTGKEKEQEEKADGFIHRAPLDV